MIVCGDSREVLASIPDNYFHSVVTDCPYGLSFMGRDWDKALPDPEIWRQCLRVMKPGAHLAAFGAPRLYHRLACQIEDVGFEIRDCVMWMFGSAMPKSLNVSKAIDKALGAEPTIVGQGSARCHWIASGEPCQGHGDANGRYGETVHAQATAATTDDARAWEGYGTALKPAYEPILIARKPLVGTVARNVLEHGAGCMNIDACRIPSNAPISSHYGSGTGGGITIGEWKSRYQQGDSESNKQNKGRWPANVALDPDAAEALDAQTGTLKQRGNKNASKGKGGTSTSFDMKQAASGSEYNYGDSGGASRFFYCAKASRSEREAGLESMRDESNERQRVNEHPTVKPLGLMRWLAKLITPKDGRVLDPFAGSGSTIAAAALEGFDALGIEREQAYADIARARESYWKEQSCQ